MKLIKDLSGQKFSRLLVLKISNNRLYGKVTFDCICDCGKTVSVTQTSLQTKNTTSCGCYRLEKWRQKTQKAKGESGFNRLLYRYKYAAKYRNLNFELTSEQFRQLTKENCYYCNAPPMAESSDLSKSTSKEGKKHSLYVYSGIDRYINSLGYSEKNCVPCCGFCNIRKMGIDGPEYEDYLLRAADNVRKRYTIRDEDYEREVE